MLQRAEYGRGDCENARSPAPVQCRHAASIVIRARAAKILFPEATRGHGPAAQPHSARRERPHLPRTCACSSWRAITRRAVSGLNKYARRRTRRAAARSQYIHGAQPAVAAGTQRGGTFHTTPHLKPTRRPQHYAQPCVYGMPTRRSYRFVRLRSQNLIPTGDVRHSGVSLQPPQPSA